MEKFCPNCKKPILRVPLGRILNERLGVMLHTADEYQYQCLDNKCGYKEEIERIDTEYGKKLKLPWYKRLF